MKIVRNGATDQEMKDCVIAFIHTKPMEVGMKFIQRYKDDTQKLVPLNHGTYFGKNKAIEHINTSNFKNIESITFSWRGVSE